MVTHLISDVLRNDAFQLFDSLHVLGVLPPELRCQRHDNRRNPNKEYHRQDSSCGARVNVVDVCDRPISESRRRTLSSARAGKGKNRTEERKIKIYLSQQTHSNCFSLSLVSVIFVPFDCMNTDLFPLYHRIAYCLAWAIMNTFRWMARARAHSFELMDWMKLIRASAEKK